MEANIWRKDYALFLVVTGLQTVLLDDGILPVPRPYSRQEARRRDGGANGHGYFTKNVATLSAYFCSPEHFSGVLEVESWTP